MIPPIDPFDLAARLGNPGAPMIVDVCLPDDIAAAPDRVPGAFRMGHGDIDRQALLRLAGPRTDAAGIVVICQRGSKLSLGAAARLHGAGARARILAGGMVAWRAAGLPVTPDAALPATNLWVCADDPATDAALSHWILSRFAPPGAELLAVPRSARADVADRFDACEIESPVALARTLGVDRPALDILLKSCAAPGPLARLLARAAERSDLCQHGTPALSLLDLVYADARQGNPA